MAVVAPALHHALTVGPGTVFFGQEVSQSRTRSVGAVPGGDDYRCSCEDR